MHEVIKKDYFLEVNPKLVSGIKNFWRTIKSYLPNKGNFSNKIIISEKDCIISKEGRLSEKGGVSVQVSLCQ